MTTTNKRAGLYIHIPFCRKKCRYCDFLSFEKTDRIEEYFEALASETEGSCADTVFIGGGTPSLVDPGYIEKVLEKADIDKDAEITIEANPESLTRDKLLEYRYMGINRISIGVQSLDDDCLRLLGRVHDRRQAIRAYDEARKASFENVNLDLMFAVPVQTEKILTDTVNEMISMEPEHISAYSLQIEEGTPFHRMFEAGKLKETSEETDRRMYHGIIETLSLCGYMQYEVSNFSKPGFSCRHNLKYWNMEDYKGAGLGASSFLDGKRIRDTQVMDEYLKGRTEAEVHNNTFEDNASEFVFTGMRKTEGISFDRFKEYTGEEFFDVYGDLKGRIGRWVGEDLMIKDDKGLRFTLKGMDIQNSILAEFIL